MKKDIKEDKNKKKKTTVKKTTNLKEEANKKEKMTKKTKTTKEKSNKKSSDRYLLMIALAFLVIGIAVGSVIGETNSNNSIKTKDKKISTLYKDIKDNYYNEISENYDEQIVISMFRLLNDPHGTIYEGIDAVNYKENIKNMFIGIGSEVSMDENNNIIFVNIFKDSPAEKSGIAVNDRLIKVDGKDVVGMDVLEAVSLIKGGKENDMVSLTILRNGEEKEFSISKSTISRDTVIVEYLNNDIAKVSISYFASTTYQELKNKLDEIKEKGIKKIALDLRDNYFGKIDVARDIADLFLTKGNIIYKEETKKGSKNYVAKSNKEYDFDIVLVTNEWTMKASEMLVCSLVDNLGIKVIGRKTGGNNSIQKVYELDNSIIELTIGKWLSPKGNDILENGINIDYIEEDSNINSRIIELLTDNSI